MERQSQGRQVIPLSTKVVLLVLRYTAAVVVAFIASHAALIPSGTVSYLFGGAGFSLSFIAVGFAGVMAGTFCLPPRSRFFGSIVLLGLGLGYDATVERHLNHVWGPSAHSLLLPLAIGGAAAVVFFLVRRIKKAAEPINVPPRIAEAGRS
ncbi:MAG TPA: hypothetical protein VN761_11570 [Candidatus Polarisedimenticolia bacterium]|nr:hypothetical protein [Candidatus Polarisedimenticolia bacterium]